MRSTWTDERLDDLNKRVDKGFNRVDTQFARVDEQFERVNLRLDHMGRAIVFGAIAMSSATIASLGAVFAVIATKL